MLCSVTTAPCTGYLIDTLPPCPASRSVVVIDWRVSGALRLCGELTAACGTGVVMMAVPDTVDAGVQALTAGAGGIVYQSQPASDVARAVDVVAQATGVRTAPRRARVVAAVQVRPPYARNRASRIPTNG